MPLGPHDPVYLEGEISLKTAGNDLIAPVAEKRFREGWKHPDKTYHLESIYYINQAGPEAQRHLAQNRAYL